MTTNEQMRATDDAQWKLEGIQAERGRLQARLKYLDEQEAFMRDRAMTGPAPAAKPTKSNDKGNGKGKRARRVFSAETKKKMADAQRRRWEQRKQLAEQGAAPVPPPMETAVS
jgi:hypothetical protein